MATYTVEFDYQAKSNDELSVRKGDIITDAVGAEDGWLKGDCRGKKGYVAWLRAEAVGVFDNGTF